MDEIQRQPGSLGMGELDETVPVGQTLSTLTSLVADLCATDRLRAGPQCRASLVPQSVFEMALQRRVVGGERKVLHKNGEGLSLIGPFAAPSLLLGLKGLVS